MGINRQKELWTNKEDKRSPLQPPPPPPPPPPQIKNTAMKCYSFDWVNEMNDGAGKRQQHA